VDVWIPRPCNTSSDSSSVPSVLIRAQSEEGLTSIGSPKAKPDDHHGCTTHGPPLEARSQRMNEAIEYGQLEQCLCISTLSLRSGNRLRLAEVEQQDVKDEDGPYGDPEQCK
jgi:hypothetical protein